MPPPTKQPVAYAENFYEGASFCGLWWSFVFGVRCLWRHNLKSNSFFQTNVLAEIVDIICMLFYDTHSPFALESNLGYMSAAACSMKQLYFLCYILESNDDTSANATTISGCSGLQEHVCRPKHSSKPPPLIELWSTINRWSFYQIFRMSMWRYVNFI